jgi:glycine cleavage system protein P-like pyridoxal-binding family
MVDMVQSPEFLLAVIRELTAASAAMLDLEDVEMGDVEMGDVEMEDVEMEVEAKVSINIIIIF